MWDPGNFFPGMVCIDKAGHVNGIAKRKWYVREILINNVVGYGSAIIIPPVRSRGLFFVLMFFSWLSSAFFEEIFAHSLRWLVWLFRSIAQIALTILARLCFQPCVVHPNFNRRRVRLSITPKHFKRKIKLCNFCFSCWIVWWVVSQTDSSYPKGIISCWGSHGRSHVTPI